MTKKMTPVKVKVFLRDAILLAEKIANDGSLCERIKRCSIDLTFRVNYHGVSRIP